jgi:hypothetical protein
MIDMALVSKELVERINEPVRWLMISSLAYATYLVYWCPCKTPVGCKQTQFYTSVLIPVAVTWALN